MGGGGGGGGTHTHPHNTGLVCEFIEDRHSSSSTSCIPAAVVFKEET